MTRSETQTKQGKEGVGEDKKVQAIEKRSSTLVYSLKYNPGIIFAQL